MANKMKISTGLWPLSLCGLVMATDVTANAQSSVSLNVPMTVNTNSAGDSMAPASGMSANTGGTMVTVRLHVSAYAVNLRSGGNPISPHSEVTASFSLNIGSASNKYDFMVKFPGTTAGEGKIALPKENNVQLNGMKKGQYHIKSGSTDITSQPGAGGQVYGNAIVIRTPIGLMGDPASMRVWVNNYDFRQDVKNCGDMTPVYGAAGYSTYQPSYACQGYMGKTGELSARLDGVTVSSDKTIIDVNVSFPGQPGFAGGYFSPLMVFFDEARPKFINKSSFPLNDMGDTFWPEANSSGYFLALDREGKGVINKRDQVFGESAKYRNGFEELRVLDSNHDGVINSKDKDFEKLVLWNDKNGDGVSQSEEVTKLSSKITKISLKYKLDQVVPLSAYAEERERSYVWYKTKNGQSKKADIIDVWVKPAVMDNKLAQQQ